MIHPESSPISAALVWAGTLITVALLGRWQVIPHETAGTLTIAVPILAVAGMGALGRTCCLPRAGGRS